VFLARLADPDFRLSLKRLVLRTKKRQEWMKNDGFIINSTSYSEETGGQHRGKSYEAVFNNLYKKVSFTQFILDSLIALSFYFARITVPIGHSRVCSSCIRRLTEDEYSIHADMLKSISGLECLHDFFNECNPSPVTAYDYNVIEYFPAHFNSLKRRHNTSDDTLMQ
jgi:hypothetical protein